MEERVVKLSKHINNCLLRKLSKEYYENDFHAEYQVRKDTLPENFQEMINLLENLDSTLESEILSELLPCLLILYLELESSGPWNTEINNHKQYSKKLDDFFANKHSIRLDEVLQNGCFDSQLIFDKCIKELHKKMTVDNFKKYPGLIEVYCLLIKDVKNYKIILNPVTVLPVALLLIDDYVTENKIKGLLSCTTVLQNLTTEDFTAGNYFEVVYSSLKKNIVEKDKKVTQVLFQCFIEFLKVVPPDIKKTKLDDIFSCVVDELHMESNLYRKADCFDFLTKIIEMHRIHCVKKKVFKDIIRDNIDICSDEGVYEILLLHVLECFEMWIRYCWCVWKLPADHKMLSSLFKILYLSKEEKVKSKVLNLILTLIKLCTKEEQIDILENLDDPLKCTNQDFLDNIQLIKRQINC